MTDTRVTIIDSQIKFSVGNAAAAAHHIALLKRLARARRHIAMGEENIARLQDIIGRLERGGHDSSVANELLARFERLQELQVADRDRLERLLAQLPK